MNNLIVILTIICSVVGLILSIQTLVNTRKKYYNEYINKKRHGKN